LELYSGSIHKLTDYAADGSRIEYTVSPWGPLSLVEKFDKEGHKTGNIDPKTVRMRMEDDSTQPVSMVNPTDEWSKGEKPGIIKENINPPPPPPQEQQPEYFD
jgi:hypothetical protein